MIQKESFSETTAVLPQPGPSWKQTCLETGDSSILLQHFLRRLSPNRTHYSRELSGNELAYFSLVTTEEANILLNPFQGGQLISDSEVELPSVIGFLSLRKA